MLKISKKPAQKVIDESLQAVADALGVTTNRVSGTAEVGIDPSELSNLVPEMIKAATLDKSSTSDLTPLTMDEAIELAKKQAIEESQQEEKVEPTGVLHTVLFDRSCDLITLQNRLKAIGAEIVEVGEALENGTVLTIHEEEKDSNPYLNLSELYTFDCLVRYDESKSQMKKVLDAVELQVKDDRLMLYRLVSGEEDTETSAEKEVEVDAEATTRTSSSDFFFAINDLVESNIMHRTKVFKTNEDAVKEFSVLREYGHRIILNSVEDHADGVSANFSVMRI